MTAHNPALPHLRRQLARQHRGRLRALWQIDPLWAEGKVGT